MRVLLWCLVPGLLGLAPPLRADEAKKLGAKRFEVPYRLTIPKHILVRAKINGKGPFNFILDTGAPALFVSTKACARLGVKRDKSGWGTFDRFEIEGGVVLEKARGRIEDPFQLEGMNGLGLAGAELHGVIGYNILAQFRMEIDFTRDKMTWTPLDWTPKAPMGIGGKGGQGGLEIMGTIMAALGKFLGRKATPDYVYRGFLGFGVTEDDGVVVVRNVLAKGPAGEGGLKAGDRLVKIKGRSVYGLDGLQELTRNVVPGDKLTVKVQRGPDKKEVDLTITAGEGL
jgi:hypothetical protein